MLAIEVASGMLQMPRRPESTQSSDALTIRLATATYVGTHARCMLKNARLSSSIAPLNARPSENAARHDATIAVFEGEKLPCS